MLDGGQALNHETEAATPTSVSERKLTAEEQDKLARDTDLVSAFKQNKLEEEAQRNWDLFYKRNTTKFFKDRHWTTHEFKELCDKKVGFITHTTYLLITFKLFFHKFHYGCDSVSILNLCDVLYLQSICSYSVQWLGCLPYLPLVHQVAESKFLYWPVP